MAKFTKYFKKSFLSEEISPDIATDVPMDDNEAMVKTFDEPENAEGLDTEMNNMSITPEQKAIILKKADKYSDQIANHILPILRKLHDDITSGVFKTIAPDVRGISNINSDLAELAEQIRGKIRDGVIKQDQQDQKNKK